MQNKKLMILSGALVVGLLTFFTSCTDSRKQEEQEALDFLYANMPLPDSVDYSRDFWQQNVAVTVRARHEMPWGEKVPSREWRHFVLPLRVNNEDLDSFRIAYYEELRDRVQGKTMFGAVLEVNHWCHEHVSYEPSDSRTSSPVNTLRSAFGRCGEESTFTVSALRAIGIPARQVYTPRWAHTDDNHAWVEAWVDGLWYFLGACEPEPVLNLGWFNDAASRGMLMHTRAFGDYNGPEEQLGKNACYTDINVTKNYAEVATVKVNVIGRDSLPLSGAMVDFRIYNYAEFYPLASKVSDERGQCTLTCGRGDLIVWAAKDGQFGFCKINVGRDDLVTLCLDKDSTYTASLDFDLTAPLSKDNRPEVAEESHKANRRRLACEDSIRVAYMQQVFCQDGEDGSPERLARANWRVIRAFRESDAARQCRGDVLSTLSRKDYRDVTLDVLLDVAEHTPFSDHPFWHDYVLSPRVSNERLTPCRAVLGQYFGGSSVEQLLQWTTDSITLDDTRNPLHLCMSPLGVLSHRLCDAHSRDIFFVTAARSIGIAARIDDVTGKVQWADEESQWHDVHFGATAEATAPQGTFALTYADQKVKQNPAYYTHFALSRMVDGRPQQMSYAESATWAHPFADGVSVDAGQYMLLSGTRLANGGVTAHLEFFGVKAAQRKQVQLKMRTDGERLRVIGSFNSELGFTNFRGVHKQIMQSTGRGPYMIGLIRSGHEPSIHLLHDMEDGNLHLSQWDHCYLMLFPSQEDFDHFDRKEFDGLPSNVVFGVADPETVEAMHIQELTKGNEELPILILADTFNRVYWLHQGYSIGMGDKIVDVLRRFILGE